MQREKKRRPYRMDPVERNKSSRSGRRAYIQRKLEEYCGSKGSSPPSEKNLSSNEVRIRIGNGGGFAREKKKK